MRVIVVGAGFGGIAAAIELRRHGFDEVTLLEAAPELGGTWYYNTYPGATCDVPSHLYSFSYAQRTDWPRLCSPQSEILNYLRSVADEFGITDRVVTGVRVTACNWDDHSARWAVHTEDGTVWHAEAIVLATGQLNQPHIPEIEGQDDYTGRSFHSARWDHDYDLTGKRVAVIGTGASAVQFVPEIARQAGQLFVFQRSGNWFMARRNRPYPRWLKALFAVPGVQRTRRRYVYHYSEMLTAAIRHPRTVGRLVGLCSAAFMRYQLRDPDVRRKAWPDYTFGCKRVLFSSEYLPALQRENVELITEPIARLTPAGIKTEDGRHVEVDCIIYGTGFKTNDFMFPMEITGVNGRSLRDVWRDGAHAYLGMTVPGFPSMFVLYGPNTNTSGGSIIFYLEAQARYLRQALQEVRARNAAAIDVRPEVEAKSDQELQRRFTGTAWTRCSSWYRDRSGRVVANWPGYMGEYARRTKKLNLAEYRLIHPQETSEKARSAKAEETV